MSTIDLNNNEAAYTVVKEVDGHTIIQQFKTMDDYREFIKIELYNEAVRMAGENVKPFS